MDADAQEILDFWIGTVGPTRWYAVEPDLDREITARFRTLWDEARTGGLAGWARQPQTCLAYMILLDQFPRNMFRDGARAFATDPQAREVARHALARGLDTSLPPVWRWFFYLPFEHSEDPHDQRLAVSLFETLALHHRPRAEALDYARRHLDIIERFGRFPHRNVALGRASTEEEAAFLQQPGSSF
jgi:uncharacterized protein (DUF924 family)